MVDQLVLEFRAAGHLLATPARRGVQVRATHQLVSISQAALPLRGVLASGQPVPLVDLGYLLGWEPSQMDLAIEAPDADGPIAFQVDVALDVRAVPTGCFRALPPLLRALVPRPDALSLALVSEQVLPVLDLNRLLTADERRGLREQCAQLLERVSEIGG